MSYDGRLCKDVGTCNLQLSSVLYMEFGCSRFSITVSDGDTASPYTIASQTREKRISDLSILRLSSDI